MKITKILLKQQQQQQEQTNKQKTMLMHMPSVQ